MASLPEKDKVYAEKFVETSHKKQRYNLFNFTYVLKRQNKNDSIYRCDVDKCNASITIIDQNSQVIKVSGVKVDKKITSEDVAVTHKHPSSELEIIRKNFEYNLVARSSIETLPLPRVHQQELDKMYLLAAQKGYSDQEIVSTLKTFHSKKRTM